MKKLLDSLPFHWFFCRAIIYYFTTTISAVILGIILVTTIGPGLGQKTIKNIDDNAEQKPVYTADTLLDLVR